MYSTPGSTEDAASHVGKIGEVKFRHYADCKGIPYLWVDQHRDTMPAWLRPYARAGGGKRPDAVVGTGDDVLLIEVKYRSRLDAWEGEQFALDKKDAERLAETERLLGKPVLLAYRDKKEQDGGWYGMLLRDALALGKPKASQFGPYYAIAKEEFEPLDNYVSTSRARRFF